MLELDFRWSHEGNASLHGNQASLVKSAHELAKSSNRLAVEFLLKSIGTRLADRDEAYFSEALNYLCGIMLAHANKPIEAAEAIAASNVMPHSGGDALFHDAVADGVALARAQDEAIARGIPAIVLSSMPRAASAALTQTLARITKAPILRVSIGAFPNYCLVPIWLNRFLRGGAILHDHFGASDFNIELLRRCDVGAVNLLVRDPRAAAVSITKHVFGSAGVADDRIENMYSMYISWLNGWIAAEATGKIKVRWLRSTDVTNNADGLNTVVATILGTQPCSDTFGQLASANFSGQPSDSWRKSLSPGLQQKMWDLVPSSIVELLELDP